MVEKLWKESRMFWAHLSICAFAMTPIKISWNIERNILQHSLKQSKLKKKPNLKAESNERNLVTPINSRSVNL